MDGEGGGGGQGRIDHFIAGPSEEFLIVEHPKEDHNEREFKRLIMAESWTNWKSLKQEKHHKRGPHLNIIASILGLLKTFSEIIVASKCDPLARIGKQAVS